MANARNLTVQSIVRHLCNCLAYGLKGVDMLLVCNLTPKEYDEIMEVITSPAIQNGMILKEGERSQ